MSVKFGEALSVPLSHPGVTSITDSTALLGRDVGGECSLKSCPPPTVTLVPTGGGSGGGSGSGTGTTTPTEPDAQPEVNVAMSTKSELLSGVQAGMLEKALPPDQRCVHVWQCGLPVCSFGPPVRHWRACVRLQRLQVVFGVFSHETRRVVGHNACQGP